ncbi:hypothetical protein [Kiloniella sp.]|uniref:DUF7919 family protein n=1 Tax=Kiloniella sp. TaxID=1938587 RepID=UPI003B0275CE
MTYFKDLSEYSYFQEYNRPNTVNIGWLENGRKFQKETPTEEFLNRLWSLCSVSVAGSRGLHSCDLCSDSIFIVNEERNGTSYCLGSSEIRVFSDNGMIYASPNIIYHYVKKHKYNPPEEFINAVLSSPIPPDPKYFKILHLHELEWRNTPPRNDNKILKPYRKNKKRI